MQSLHLTTISECSPAQCAADLLDGVPPVIRFIRREMRRHRVSGLSVPQFRSLVFLNTYQPCSLSALAEHLGLSLPATSRLIDGLVARKFVSRETSNTDRRQVSLNLTPLGKSVYRAARHATEAQLARETASLTSSQRALVSAAMHLLTSIFATDFSAANKEGKLAQG